MGTGSLGTRGRLLWAILSSDRRFLWPADVLSDAAGVNRTLGAESLEHLRSLGMVEPHPGDDGILRFRAGSEYVLRRAGVFAPPPRGATDDPAGSPLACQLAVLAAVAPALVSAARRPSA